MLCRCVAVLFIALLAVVLRVRTASISRYFCDNRDKDSETHDLKNSFKRFFRHEDKLYFVFKNRVIFGRQPTNDADTDATTNSSLVLFNLYEQPNIEKELEDIHIQKGYQIMGYYKDRQKGFSLEMYGQDKHLEKRNQFLPYGLQLSFSGVVAERTKKIRLDEVKTRFGELSVLTEHPAIVKYIEISDREPNYRLLTMLSYYSEHSKKEGKYRNELMVNYSLELGKHSGVHYAHRIYDFPDLKWFVVYVNEFDPKNTTRIDWFLIGVNEDTYKIDFLHFPIFELNKSIDSNDYAKHRVDLILTYDELFSCHCPFKLDRELKGIYFNPRSKVFYVFIRRFYLKFDEDLVYRGFYIEPTRYLTAKNINFESEELYRSVEFEIINRKWVKTFQDQSFFIPNKQTFEIGTDTNNDIKLKLVEHNYRLRFCMDQTLVVERVHVYCFKSDRYFYWYKFGNYDYDPLGSNYTIESIFHDTAVKWPAGEKLLFIFSYQLDRVVFMTRTQLFVFRYSSFRKEEEQRIKFTVHPEDDPAIPYIVNKNCLVIKCTGPATIQTTPFPVPSIELTTAKTSVTIDEFSKKPTPKPIRLQDIKWYLIGLSLLLLIVLIFLCTWYLTRRKRYIKSGFSSGFRSVFRDSSNRRPASSPGSTRSARSARVSSAYPSSASQLTTKPQSTSALPSDKQLETIYPGSKKLRRKTDNARSLSSSSKK